MKKIFFLLLLANLCITAQTIKFGDAKGLFMSVGVGPRFPIGDFADQQNIGIGVDAVFSYTDNQLIPFFIYGSLGFQHYPGRQSLYKTSDYSSISCNVLVFSPGVRYYFPPLIEQVVLLMPIVDVGLHLAYFEKFHQFKIDRNRQNFVDEFASIGFQVGAGFSMFILDVITYYNYLHNNQYISFNLRATIPIFVSF